MLVAPPHHHHHHQKESPEKTIVGELRQLVLYAAGAQCAITKLHALKTKKQSQEKRKQLTVIV